MGSPGQLHAKKPLTPNIHQYTKINSRGIKDLKISCESIKVPEENIGRKISDIPCSNVFTDIFLKARDIKERINKWDFIKLKTSAQLKKPSSK